MKYFIISGEASGDIHGSNLVKAMLLENPSCEIQAWGGELMQDAGATVMKHYKELAFMGFAEVLLNIRTIAKNFTLCKIQIKDFQPDAIILIDYPGFNLRMAKWCHEQGIKIYYYISPQLWAWKSSRISSIKKYVEKLFVILPFEKDFYKKNDLDVMYVGHPLIEHIANFKNEKIAEESYQKPYILLLPGSRVQEVKKILPVMLSITKDFPQYHFYIAQAPGLDKELFNPFIQKFSNVHLVSNKSYPLLQEASAALVASGTATLETALFQVPQIVCYAANPLSVWLAKKLVGSKIKFISLVNLIMDKEVIRELIQEDLNHENLKKELQKILQDASKIIDSYKELKQMLGDGTASQKVASYILLDTKK